MVKLNVSEPKALLIWECLDMVMRSGAVKNPQAMVDLVELRKQLEVVPHVRKSIRAAMKAAEAQNARKEE